ncbi:SGT1 and CS domain-containing protein [Cordyceps javanica]|uniref:SGT1 and CS domain-containing protein n=1 Tax=Cordyceps javanica TaxID=43265 RepID=A0A545UM81_9HYPO|nr:SGT1 and CS domain-containing protein [Cordyceps javanica]TQW02013.1 SGT1 and CS domain containing protein [Cordyceps javanica]
MSHITLAQQGLAAAEAKDWDGAIAKLSKALQSSPNPAWLLARSKSLLNLGRFDAALDDANLAWHTAFARNKRPLMSEAHYRRAVAYFRLGRLADADACCVYAMRLIKGASAVDREDPVAHLRDPDTGRWTPTVQDAMHEARTDDFNGGGKQGGDRGAAALAMSGGGGAAPQAKEWRIASTLRVQILSAMAKLPADDPARMATAPVKPEEKELANPSTTSEDKKSAEEAKSAAPSTSTADEVPAPAPQAPAPAPAKPVVPSDTPLRLQEFQSGKNMTVSIFSKGVNKDKLKVDFQPRSVHLENVIYPSGDERAFHLDLWGEIDTADSGYTVTPNKVELCLVKRALGKWPQVQSDGKADTAIPAAAATSTTTTTPPATTEPAAAADAKAKPAAAPAYPSSSRTGPKNWDTLDVGDDGKDEADSGDVNFFFKKLFKDATPEQQRAMMKSFTESNGTSLSTDWNDVKDRTVETVPPEGVEARKWN